MSATATTTRAQPSILPALLTLGVGIAAMIALFWPECRAAVKVWSESTAYGHCYLVIPIAAYLAWDRRDALRGLIPQPNAALALIALPLPFVWLAAERLGIMEGRQLIAIALLQVLFLTVLGWRLFRALSGPLLYLFFLVPFGLFLTPVLQVFTAHFIEVGLNLLGIPHFITNMTIEISSGTFYVAEACAGLRFLIASIAFGVFFALLNYRSPGRRTAFIAASIVIPIIANGFRALGIVVLGNILGSAQAAAADHLIYGWFFFSFVTLLLVMAGLPFRETPAAAAAAIDDARNGPFPARNFNPRAAIPLIILALLGPAAAMALDRNIAPARLATHPTLTPPEGCTIDPAPPTATPSSATPAGATPSGDSATYLLTCNDRALTVTLLAIPGRSTGAALAQARLTLTGPIDDEESVTGTLPGHPAWRTLIAHNPGLVVATASWIDGQPAPGGIAQRLLQARDSLLGTTHDALVMAIAYRPGAPIGEAEANAALAQLSNLISAQPNLDQTIAQTTKR